nr:bifunctional diguanylate cyclase/phosphodiesterase [Afifella sp. IM 167]
MLVGRAIAEEVASLSQDQKSVASWDEAARRVRADDREWLHENIGLWMRDYFQHDRTIILSAKDEILVQARSDRLAGGPAEDMIAAFGPHLAALRSGATTGKQENARRGITLIDGRPAVVSAIQIVPHSARLAIRPGEEGVLLSAVFLDSAFLQRLRSAYALSDARIRLTNTARAWETALPVTGGHGAPVAYLVWDPRLPGEHLLKAILPTALFTGLVVLFVVGLYARHIYRSSAALEASEVHARHLAYHDGLTGLPNRAHLLHRLDRLLPFSGEDRAVLLFVDLDRFKEVNDTYGHQAGDEVIRQFAGRAERNLSGVDMLGRLGGDEFAVLLRGVASEEEVTAFAARILSCGFDPFLVPGGSATIGVSVGYAWLEPELSRSEVLRRADVALYAAKREGRGRFCAFSPETDAAMRTRRQLEDELRLALARGGEGLLVYYQPLLSARDGTFVGVEALVRWQHPRLGFVSPALFVPIAEESGLVSCLDQWVLVQACRDARAWPDLVLAVNVSPRSFERPGLAARIRTTLSAEGIHPRRLEVEVTESLLLAEHSRAQAELQTMRQSGIRIALDDFGTGYSSLSRLRTLKVDKVKIDRSFVMGLGETGGSTAIIDAVIDLGHALGVTVLAEGVETERQREHLRTAGCDELQGFLFSPPVPAEEISAMLEAEWEQGAA